MPTPARNWALQPKRVTHKGLRFDAEKASGELTVSLSFEHPIWQVLTNKDPGATLYLGLVFIDDIENTMPQKFVAWPAVGSKV